MLKALWTRMLESLESIPPYPLTYEEWDEIRPLTVSEAAINQAVVSLPVARGEVADPTSLR